MGENDCTLVGLLLFRDEAGPGQKFSSLPLFDLKGDFLGGEGERLGGSSSVVEVFLDFFGDLVKKFIESRRNFGMPCWTILVPVESRSALVPDFVTLLYLWLADCK